jgi:hypothetical protein
MKRRYRSSRAGNRQLSLHEHLIDSNSERAVPFPGMTAAN